MTYGIKITRDDDTQISFDGLFSNFRVVRTELVEHRVQPQYFSDVANYNGVGPSTSAFSCASSFDPILTEPYILFRRYISLRSEVISPETTLYYVTYKYLICERSVTPPSGYGAVIYDAHDNVVFNSNDAYAQVYDISIRSRYDTFNIPTPPTGLFSYCHVPSPGQLVYIIADFNGVEAFYQTIDVTATQCLVGRGYLPGTSITTLSTSPHIYPTQAAADAASQSIAGSDVVQVAFAAYKD